MKERFFFEKTFNFFLRIVEARKLFKNLISKIKENKRRYLHFKTKYFFLIIVKIFKIRWVKCKEVIWRWSLDISFVAWNFCLFCISFTYVPYLFRTKAIMTRHNFLILCNHNIICLSHISPNLCSVIYLHKHVRLDCLMVLSTLFSFRIYCEIQFLFLQSIFLMSRINLDLSVVYPKENCLFRCHFL